MGSSVKTKVTAAQAQALAERTADAYSCDRYVSWKACAAVLLRRGYTDRQAATILRSRIMRWAVDASSVERTLRLRDVEGSHAVPRSQ